MGGRTNPRGRYRKGGRLKITLSGWEARARSLASFGARGLQGRWRWGGQSGIPPPRRGGVPACAPRLHVCGAARRTPCTRPWAHFPRTGRSWQRAPPPPQPSVAGVKRSVIYYLRALIGWRRLGVGGKGAMGIGPWGQGWGRGADRREEVPAWAPAFRIHCCPAPPRRRVLGPRRAFDFASRPLSFASSPFPRRREGGCGPSAPLSAPLAAAAASPTQPGPHLSSSLVKWSVQGTAASLG